MAESPKKQPPLLCFCDLVDKLVQACWLGGAVLLGVLMCLLAFQIFVRTFFNSPVFGIEEGVTAMVVWMACLGTAVVTRQNGHAQVEYFLRFFPEKARVAIRVLINAVGMWAGVMLIDGGLLLYKVQAKSLPTGGLWFRKCYYYALPVIVLGVLMLLVCLCHIIRVLAAQERSREGGDII